VVWDEPKRQRNIAKHGLDFAVLTSEFFENARIEGARSGRFLAVGEFEGVTIIAVVFRQLGSKALSIISMRRANRAERNRS
jgi:uncharacterized DUF497 family protein